ncbi:hypothetical protein FRB99_002682 [Tulasnella sp. 403]|nr:hypothetical protein FRB99_002682 [Tulasnella sp. 403]
MPDTDDLAMPHGPTWSVQELLASYPAPTLEPSTLVRLHKLSALHAPEEGSSEFETLRKDLAEMVRMVEAVKTVDLPKEATGIPDARIWPESLGMDTRASSSTGPDLPPEPSGQQLMQNAERTADGFYMVESDRKRSRS